MVHKKSSLIRVFMFVQIDEVISQAQTTRAVLGSQRALFGDVQGKVKNLSDKFPVIRGLLGTILFHTISGSFSFSDPAYYSFFFETGVLFICFPLIAGSIKRRRSRDTIILSAVIAACTLFLIIYWLSK